MSPAEPSTPPTMPGDLVAWGPGRKLWRAVTREFVLGPDEVVLLAEACRMLDLAEVLREQVEQDGPVVEGSRGQKVAHPALVELRQTRSELRLTLGRLNLPDADGETPSSKQAREAAQARWRARGA